MPFRLRALTCAKAQYGHRRSFLQALLPIVAFLCALGVGLMAFAPSASARTLHVVALGDSLTAGLGLPQNEAFPNVLQKALRDKGWDVEIVNAGVSGDTSADGLARLDWSVPDGTDAVILELGANDMLRGQNPADTRKTLNDIIRKLGERHVKVLIAGMRANPTLGADYGRSFDGLYPDLAMAYKLPLYPFFLDGVAGDPKLNQADGMHPTGKGVEIIVSRILPSVETLLQSISP